MTHWMLLCSYDSLLAMATEEGLWHKYLINHSYFSQWLIKYETGSSILCICSDVYANQTLIMGIFHLCVISTYLKYLRVIQKNYNNMHVI